MTPLPAPSLPDRLRAHAHLHPESAELLAEVMSWDGIMALVDEFYPADIWPTQPDGEDMDPGHRIVSLLRLLAMANEAFDECTGDYSAELVADEPWRLAP